MTLNPALYVVWGYNSISLLFLVSGISWGAGRKAKGAFPQEDECGKSGTGLDFVVVVCEFGWGGRLGKGFSGQVKKYLGGGVIRLIVRNHMRQEIVRCLC